MSRRRATVYTILVGGALVAACGGGGALNAPKSDSQYDDGDDPGNGGSGSTGSAPDASGDAQGRACASDRDCPASHRCSFSISSGCSATGTCLLFATTNACKAQLACGCVAGQKVTLCAPPGYANAPVTSCGDAGVDASVADAADASLPDAASAPDSSVDDSGRD